MLFPPLIYIFCTTSIILLCPSKTMNMDGEKNNEKKAAASKLISKSWLEKLEVCRREEEKLRNDIQELDKWVTLLFVIIILNL